MELRGDAEKVKSTGEETKKASMERKDMTDKGRGQGMSDKPSDSAPKSKLKDSKGAMNKIVEQKKTDGTQTTTPSKAKHTSSDDRAKKRDMRKNKRERPIAPQSDVERSTRAKSRRRNLDPAAAEAAAVAAAADKKEATTHRRRTRLTSGKISKVVYTSPQKLMTDDGNENAVEKPTQPRALPRREKARRSSRRRTKAVNKEVPEDGASLERDELAKEAHETSSNVYMLSQLANAVRRTASTTPGTIVTELRGKSINTSEAKDVLKDMMDNIRQVNSIVGLKSEGTDMTDQMLAYIATELTRWKSGQPRPTSVISKRKTRLESKRAAIEKQKRRGKKEHDDAMSKLAIAKEERRGIDLNTAKMRHEVYVMNRDLEKRKQRVDALMKEVQDVRMQDEDGNERIEKHLRLFGQLEQMAKNNVAVGGELQSIGESVTSNDEDMPVTVTSIHSGRAPTNSARLAEVERLRRLIRQREVEAENWQRECEMNSIRLRELQEKKNKLDIQLNRKHTREVTKLLAAANSATKKKNECADKNRQAKRGDGQVGNGRSKGGVTKPPRRNARRDEKGKRRAGRPANS